MEFSENEKIFFQKALPTCCPSCIGAVPAFQRAEKDSSLSVPERIIVFQRKAARLFQKDRGLFRKDGQLLLHTCLWVSKSISTILLMHLLIASPRLNLGIPHLHFQAGYLLAQALYSAFHVPHAGSHLLPGCFRGRCVFLA